MLPIPAIDVLDGRVVRLRKGSYTDVTEYPHDPITLAAAYADAGGGRVHLVDLTGARDGAADLDLIERVTPTVPDLQVGGGIRDLATAQAVLAAGARRIVIGSLAVHAPAELGRIAAAVGPEAIVVAVDVSRGRARGSGWTDEGVAYLDVIEAALDAGIRSLLVTGIERDGMLTGPDTDLVRSVRTRATDIELIASGGIADLDDLQRAADAGATAAVVGRALLEGRFTLEALFERYPPT